MRLRRARPSEPATNAERPRTRGLAALRTGTSVRAVPRLEATSGADSSAASIRSERSARASSTAVGRKTTSSPNARKRSSATTTAPLGASTLETAATSYVTWRGACGGLASFATSPPSISATSTATGPSASATSRRATASRRPRGMRSSWIAANADGAPPRKVRSTVSDVDVASEVLAPGFGRSTSSIAKGAPTFDGEGRAAGVSRAGADGGCAGLARPQPAKANAATHAAPQRSLTSRRGRSRAWFPRASGSTDRSA